MKISSGRRAVTAGSFWRTAPAAAFRGLAKVVSPASSRVRFSLANAARGMNTSPRTSSSSTAASGPLSTIGMDRMVLRGARRLYGNAWWGLCWRGAAMRFAASARVMKERIAEAASARSLPLPGGCSYTRHGEPMARFSPPNAVRSSTPKTRSAPKDATASVQDYLAAIYDLQSSGKPVIGARLAKHMAISAPAVSEAIQRPSRAGYVRVGRGKELTLTPRGRQIAEVMARRHRLLERWLTDTLGLNWTDAHEEAHRLEHALSPRVEDRLAELLGMPSTCPHGNPIPGMAKPTRVEPFPLAH